MEETERPQLAKLRLPAEDGDMVMKEAMSLDSVRELLDEEQGYDAPFETFTWRYWLELQARAVQSFTRFVRAVGEKRPDHLIMIGLEMQEIATTMLLEAYAQSASLPSVPPRAGEHEHEREREH